MIDNDDITLIGIVMVAFVLCDNEMAVILSSAK